MGIGPAAGNELPMPAQKGRWPHDKHGPPAAAQHAGGCGEEDPVGIRQLRPSDLSTQDGQFVTEDHDLEVLGGTAPELKRPKNEHASGEHIENGGKHTTEFSRHRRAAATGMGYA
jgi:hypothetical protein